MLFTSTVHDHPFSTDLRHPPVSLSGVPREGFGVLNPPSKIPKALQNSSKLNPIVKTVKNC